MRFTGAIACALVAYDCLQKASGDEPQKLFSGEAIWLWWVVAFFWVIAVFRFILAID